ncbi:unnamed protein product [Lactuca saligna]|uniref:DUF4378 domain-containing protein n=1 Tax=Lactuca saligna TaxID=75948 RepID=A0AA36DVD7_LACSI|nr:unnamed protein product [Lactuca saligna]
MVVGAYSDVVQVTETLLPRSCISFFAYTHNWLYYSSSCLPVVLEAESLIQDLNLLKVMENSQSTTSVIAKLMGFDETPPHQQPVSRQQKVLSDNYLQKSGSIGKRSRTYSQNNLLGSKKRVNQRTNDSYVDQKVLSSESNRENGKSDTVLTRKKIFLKPNLANTQQSSRPSFLLDSQTTFAWEAKKQLLERLKMTRVFQERQSSRQKCCNLGESFSLNNTKSTSRLGSSIGISSNEGSGKLVNVMHTNTKKNQLVSNSATPFVASSNTDAGTEDVLEPPFREDNSSNSEYCESSSNDLHDLWMEDDFGPEMATSSDDERSCTGQTLGSMTPFGATESRDFSYMVDVLDESAFQDGDVEIRFEKWHSSECMASYSIFETLEKKYGKQELWQKSERKLLFDRINSGMIEILRPRIDIRVSPNLLQRKMRNMSRRDVIEEELSMFLLNQEKGVNDGVSEKAVGREPWFDPLDEIDSLVTELEIFLFDKLTAELVNV